MKTIEVPMTQEKETLGTFRFRSDEPTAAILILYIRKAGFVAGAPVPKKVVVTIDAPDEVEESARPNADT